MLLDKVGISNSKIVFAEKYKRMYIFGSQKPSSYNFMHLSLANS